MDNAELTVNEKGDGSKEVLKSGTNGLQIRLQEEVLADEVVDGSQVNGSRDKAIISPAVSSSTTSCRDETGAETSPETEAESVDAGPFQRPSYQNINSEVSPPLTPTPEEHRLFVDQAYEIVSSKESEYYDLSQGTKLVMIFNHRKFEFGRQPSRRGTDLDVQVIRLFFTVLKKLKAKKTQG